ncbi:relaxase domain-containing protein [Alcaligenaceae bacterium]|nr:relaxase domain-containing protein [Alcaligenaceae bacterium]
MITKKILYRSDAAKNTHYYEDQADDYYSRDGSAALWQGRGAQMLGASGQVDIRRFQAMLQGNFGRGVKTSARIRKDAKARSALDLTISAPKSVSLAALVGGDERIIAAHDKAVTRALTYAEAHLAQGRKTIKGKVHVQRTGNLAIAKFRHETARETPDAVPDPQLHTHAIIMNLTRLDNGSWVTLSNDQIVKLRPLLDSVYMAELARELTDLGYDIRFEKQHIELAHISRDQIEHFSKRTAQIMQQLSDRSLSRSTASHAQRQVATLATRKAKAPGLARADLHANWVQQARDVGLDLGKGLATAKERAQHLTAKDKAAVQAEARQRVADVALLWAIKHMAERETVMPHAELIATAGLHAQGVVSTEQIEAALQRLVREHALVVRPDHYQSNSDLKAAPRTRQAWAQELAQVQRVPLANALSMVDQAIHVGRLSRTERLYATRTALEREKQIIAMEREGRGTMAPIIEAHALQKALAGTTLTAGQRDAVNLMLAGQNQIVGIQGLAGTGKSFALQSTQELLREQGYRMLALAPYGTQVANLRRDGIEANTVASRLEATDTARQQAKINEKTVVVIDEAGVIPVREMQRLLTQLKPTGARIVLLGDTAQTKAVEAGRAFALMQENGMKTALMGDIQRQKNERLKRAVELAASGKTRESLALMDQVVEIPDTFVESETGKRTRDGTARYEAIARQYVALSRADQAQTLIVTGTNASRKAINALVHQYRGLQGKGRMVKLLTRHDTTRAQRRCAKYYTVGDIVQPERDYKNGMKRGQLYRVTECSDRIDRITVEPLHTDSGENAQAIQVIPKMMSTLSVYRQHEAEISPGDVVRVTRNNAELDLANGERYEVLQVGKDQITIAANGRAVTLPADQPLHLDHAYATTAHSAQGLTCDRVFYNAESASRTTAQDTYYVSISRERHEVIVFTDDADRLPSSVARVPYKSLAHDLQAPVQQRPPHEVGPFEAAVQHVEMELS